MTSKIEIWESEGKFKYRYSIEGEGLRVYRENISDQELKQAVLQEVHEAVTKAKVTFEKEI